MGRWEEEQQRKAENAERRYREWAERERQKGDAETADRLSKKADALHRTHVTPRGGSSASSSGGCAVLLIALAAVPPSAWTLVEYLT